MNYAVGKTKVSTQTFATKILDLHWFIQATAQMILKLNR